jgi:AbrB family looped-hinge helix DNA binding protein
MQTTMTSKGQVTIPRDVRQHFGLKQGMAISFAIEGDHITLRAAHVPSDSKKSGFGLVRSRRKGVPANFDVASLLTDAP